MSVRIVTDSAAELSERRARELGVTVVDLHLQDEGEQVVTAGPSSLELCATYARQLERGHDDGVLALHVSRELSSTWNAAVTAAAVFDDTVEVIDTRCAGAAMGEAAAAAARVARVGGSITRCREAAESVLENSSTWLYVHTLEQLRRSGRMSMGAAMMSSALAPRPLMRLADGKLEMAARTRTRTKAFNRLSEMMTGEVEDRGGGPVDVIIQHNGAAEECEALGERLTEVLPEGSDVSTVAIGPVIATHIGEGSAVFSMVARPAH